MTSIPIGTAWPANLPLPYVDFTGAPRNATVASPIEDYAIARRHRFQKDYPVLQLTWVLSIAQYINFKSFYITDLDEGTALFQIELKYPKESELTVWIIRFNDNFDAAYQDNNWTVVAAVTLISPLLLPDASHGLGLHEFLTGSSSGLTAITCSIHFREVFSVSIAGLTTVTASIVTRKTLTGSIAGFASVSCSILIKKKLSCSIAGSTGVTCSVLVDKGFSGAIAGSTLVSCSILVKKPLACSIAGSTSVTCTLTVNSTVDPTTFSNLFGWWKADSYSLSDGTAVGGTGNEWVEASGTGKTWVQGTSGNRPVFKTAIFNGKPVLRFDASNDFMGLLPSDYVIGTSGDFTVVAVYAVNGDSMLLGHSSTNNQIRRLRSAANTISKRFASTASDDSSSTFGTSSGGLACCIWRRSSGVVSFRENKTSRGTASDAGAFTMQWLGATSFASVLNGDLAELVLYTGNLSDANCDSLYDSYLKSRWGLP